MKLKMIVPRLWMTHAWKKEVSLFQLTCFRQYKAMTLNILRWICLNVFNKYMKILGSLFWCYVYLAAQKFIHCSQLTSYFCSEWLVLFMEFSCISCGSAALPTSFFQGEEIIPDYCHYWYFSLLIYSFSGKHSYSLSICMVSVHNLHHLSSPFPTLSYLRVCMSYSLNMESLYQITIWLGIPCLLSKSYANLKYQKSRDLF